MTLIKICGITNKEDAIDAAKLNVDMLGFVFYKRSKRYIEPLMAKDIANELPPHIERVGVFVDEKKEKALEIGQDIPLDILQFHGDETPDYCARFKEDYKIMKAFRIKDKRSLKKINDYSKVDLYLLDAYSPSLRGGSGRSFNWELLEDFEFLRPVILSGGLTPSNVAKAIKEVSPYGVDVSTGVESSPGKKDFELMNRFVENVRKVA